MRVDTFHQIHQKKSCITGLSLPFVDSSVVRANVGENFPFNSRIHLRLETKGEMTIFINFVYVLD